MHYDVLIIGAGPAGSTVAWNVAKENYRVLLVDKKKVVGEPVQCAEYVPALLCKEIALPSECIANSIRYLTLFAPDKRKYRIAAPGYIVSRSYFDKWLAINAIQNGAELWLNTRFIKFSKHYAILQKQNKIIKIKAKIVVGADGPSSKVNRSINKRYNGYVLGYQQEHPLVRPMDTTEVYFDKRFYGGYAWLFPKRDSANVGLGIKLRSGGNADIKRLLAYFVQKIVRQGKIFASPIATTMGLIPVSGPVNSVKENIVLVGDAAGQTHPITGAGISQAVICGRIAARAIIKALKNRDLKALNQYELEWHALFYDELKRASERRNLMEQNWNNLKKYFKRIWVSFPEYYG